MPTSDFHKSIKDMNNISESVEIKLMKNNKENNYKLFFKCSGEFGQ